MMAKFSIARTARMIEVRLKRGGVLELTEAWIQRPAEFIAFERTGYDGDSQYINLGRQLTRDLRLCSEVTIRVSDHEQPAGGGYCKERQERHGEAEVDVNPTSAIAPDEAVRRALELLHEND